MHTPVLLSEVLHFLALKDGGVYLDCTVGTGGHAAAILESISPRGKLIGLDCDAEVLELAAERLKAYSRQCSLIHSNFVHLDQWIDEKVDGILMDLGVSSFQLDSATRGFSFQHKGPVDMRMDLTAHPSAYEVIHSLPEAELARIIREYGEERWATRIAQVIVATRRRRTIRTTLELADLIRQVVPKTTRIDPATRTFQAFRIYVNHELENLKVGLKKAIQVLKTDARICVISFHSLEDRLVKQTLRYFASSCTCPPKSPICICEHQPLIRILTKRPITPRPEEIQQNPRARSAKLRAAIAL